MAKTESFTALVVDEVTGGGVKDSVFAMLASRQSSPLGPPLYGVAGRFSRGPLDAG